MGKGVKTVRRSVVFIFKEVREKKEYECGMCKLEMMIESERKKRVELN